MDIFSSMPVGRSVSKNAIPAMAAMLMFLIYNHVSYYADFYG